MIWTQRQNKRCLGCDILTQRKASSEEASGKATIINVFSMEGDKFLRKLSKYRLIFYYVKAITFF
jgi:hypothetical protein